MITNSPLLERLGPADFPLPGERSSTRGAETWLETIGLPTARDEAWKYTPIDKILAASFDPVSKPTPDAVDLAMLDELAGDHGRHRLVFINGFFASELSRNASVGSGVICRSAAASTIEPFGSDIATDADRTRFDGFQALNQIAGNDGAVVLIDRDTHVREPIHVVYLSVPGAKPTASHPRTLLRAATNSEVTFIETYAGRPGAGLTNAATTIVVEPGAAVTHYKIQAEGVGATHLAHTSIRQAGGSSVRSCSFMLGADIARNAVDVVLSGNDANVALDGLYLPNENQHHDNVITVEHAASSCTSRQQFKGVIDDHARGSFSGRIIVQPGTRATDAAQTSRKPALEADRRSGHASLARDLRRRGQMHARCRSWSPRLRGALLSPDPRHLGTRCPNPADPSVHRRDDRGRRADDAAFALGHRDRDEAIFRHTATLDGGFPMTSSANEPIQLVRDCIATMIPTGAATTLRVGETVRIMQTLGGNITVRASTGALLRIARADTDALNLDRPAPESALAESGSFSMSQVDDALQRVFDPEIPVSVVELGLIYRCEEEQLPDGGRLIAIDMSMTAPGCGMGDILQIDAANAVREVPGVDDVEVNLVWDPPWSINRMSEAARLQLGML